MYRVATVMLLQFLAGVALAQSSPESQAFALFEEACIHPEGQFETASALAVTRHMDIAPQPVRDAIVQKGEGAAWLAQTAPFVMLHANIEAGCGVMLKPAGDSGFSAIVDAIETAELVTDESFETSWSKWYVVEQNGQRGVLMTGLMDVSESKSAYLRYIPGKYVAEHDEARDFLLTDFKRFNRIRSRLKAK